MVTVLGASFLRGQARQPNISQGASDVGRRLLLVGRPGLVSSLGLTSYCSFMWFTSSNAWVSLIAAQRLGGIQVLAITSYFSRRPTTSIAVGACIHWNKCNLDLTVLLILLADRLVLDPSLFDGKAQQYIPFILVSMQ